MIKDLKKGDSMVINIAKAKWTNTKTIIIPLNEIQYNLIFNDRVSNLNIKFNINGHNFVSEDIIFLCKNYDSINLDTYVKTGNSVKTIRTIIKNDIVKNNDEQLIIPSKYIRSTNQVDIPDTNRDLKITFDAVEYFEYCLGNVGNPIYFVVIKQITNLYERTSQ